MDGETDSSSTFRYERTLLQRIVDALHAVRLHGEQEAAAAAMAQQGGGVV